jgi:hypothetical protein
VIASIQRQLALLRPCANDAVGKEALVPVLAISGPRQARPGQRHAIEDTARRQLQRRCISPAVTVGGHNRCRP